MKSIPEHPPGSSSGARGAAAPLRPAGPALADRARACAGLLEEIAADRSLLAALEPEHRVRLLRALSRVAHPDRTARRRESKAFRRKECEAARARRAAQEGALERTGIRALRHHLVFPTPALTRAAALPAQTETAPGVGAERNCYVCKADFSELHHFYDSLCPQCAELNWSKRWQTADLSGRTALITGARVKIGYQAAIKLLRAGARVVATTRFPRDAVQRYQREEDFETWRERLEIYGLDLRHTPSVLELTRFLNDRLDRLDFVVNNACQTVRRPPGFYAHLMEAERQSRTGLPAAARAVLEPYEELRGRGRGGPEAARLPAARAAPWLAGIAAAAELSQVELVDGDQRRGEELYPRGRLDADRQQVDLRDKNSWRLALGEVSAVELLEVHLVNAVAPFLLNGQLKPLLLRRPSRDKHVVNVSAMEGQFYRALKTDKHPHTNMAKASLNMMTRTSASDYVRDGIHMNSVDTGWITDEDPAPLAERKRSEHGFHPPLDIVDAAARILDPIFCGFLTGEHVWGQFLKDYRPAPW